MEVLVSVYIDTDKSIEEVNSAIRRGIYWGLDVKNVASPQQVGVRVLKNEIG